MAYGRVTRERVCFSCCDIAKRERANGRTSGEITVVNVVVVVFFFFFGNSR